MKKIKLSTNKLQLAKEKITDLTHEQMFKMQGGSDGASLATCWACVTYMCSTACTDGTCGCGSGSGGSGGWNTISAPCSVLVPGGICAPPF